MLGNRGTAKLPAAIGNGGLAGYEARTTAILDHLLHNAHVINIKARSYRLRDLENALASREG